MNFFFLQEFWTPNQIKVSLIYFIVKSSNWYIFIKSAKWWICFSSLIQLKTFCLKSDMFVMKPMVTINEIKTLVVYYYINAPFYYVEHLLTAWLFRTINKCPLFLLVQVEHLIQDSHICNYKCENNEEYLDLCKNKEIACGWRLFIWRNQHVIS